MDFDNSSNSTQTPDLSHVSVQEDITDLVTDESFNEFKDSIAAALTSADKHGTQEYEPAVIVFSAKEFNVQPLNDELGAIQFGIESKVYTKGDILPAENGIEMCYRAGLLAAQDKLKPVAAFLVAEAWMAAIDKTDEKFVMPRNNPDRKEVVILSGMTIGKKSSMMVYDLTRDENNNAHLTLRTTEDSEKFQGENAPLVMFFQTYVTALKDMQQTK